MPDSVAKTALMTNGPSLSGRRSLMLAIADAVTPSHDAEGGAGPLLYAATSPSAVSGKYYGPRWFAIGRPAEARAPAAALDREIGKRLWTAAERLTGTSLPKV